jgi:hypothetical protein
MRATVSFIDLLQQTVGLFSRHQRLLWFGVPFGIIAALSTKASKYLPILTNEEAMNWSILLSKIEHNFPNFLGILGVLILLSILHSLLRGPYFLSLEETLNSDKDKKIPQPISSRRYLRSALITLKYDALYWLGITLLLVTVSLPIILALRFNQSVAPLITELGFILLLVIAALFFILKEFALLYTLLAHAKLHVALELSLHLFKKHAFLTLLFSLFLILLSLLFTFPINLAIIASDFVEVYWLQKSFEWFSIGSILGISILTEESLRLFFFHALAAAPKVKTPGVEEILEKKKNASTTPLA